MSKFPLKKALLLNTSDWSLEKIETFSNSIRSDKRHFVKLLFAQDYGGFAPTRTGLNINWALELAEEKVAQLSDEEIEEFLKSVP